jgi:hypothetical protein
MEVISGNGDFLGIKVGNFILVPDSDSGTRPDTLKVERDGNCSLLLFGGDCLRVQSLPNGIDQDAFVRDLPADQTRILRKLAFDLPGRGWPAADYTLKRKIESLGEENVYLSLVSLFRRVDRKVSPTFFQKLFYR